MGLFLLHETEDDLNINIEVNNNMKNNIDIEESDKQLYKYLRENYISFFGAMIIILGIVMIFKDRTFTINCQKYPLGLVLLITGIMLIAIDIGTRETRRFTVNTFFIVFIVMLMLIILLLPTDKVPTKPKEISYDIFKNVLNLVLLITGILVALIGYTGYRIIHTVILKEVNENIAESHYRALSRNLGVVGLMCWENYEKEHNKKMKETQLDHAISLQKNAYEKYGSQLNEKKRENEKILLGMKNNLAFYFAEYWILNKDSLDPDIRNTAHIRSQLALKYSEEIKSKVGKYPDRATSWIHTYDYIKKYCDEE